MKRLLLVFLLVLGGACYGATNPVVTINTNLGDIEIELFAKEAPLSVGNFLAYAKSGFYDGVIFHRVIPKFVVQAGDVRLPNAQPKPERAPIQSEATNGLHNSRGMVSMGRTPDINSATCHFYINLADNLFLDHSDKDYGYAVFGKVIKGMDVADKMAAMPLKGELPVEPIIINHISVKN